MDNWNLGYDQDSSRHDDNRFTNAGKRSRMKHFPWLPVLGIYICVLLVAALLSGIVADSVSQNTNQDPSAGEKVIDAAVGQQGDPGSGGGDPQTGGGMGNGLSGDNSQGQAVGGLPAADGTAVNDASSDAGVDQRPRLKPYDDQPAQAEEVPAAGAGGIEVDSVSITGDTTWMRQGEQVFLTAVISPWNATDPSVTWSSSNPAVARVSQSGVVTGIGGGPVIISATTSNGLVVDYPMDVSTKEKRMYLTITRTMNYNEGVGDDWDFEYVVNGVPVSGGEDMIVVLGDTVTVSTTITENDAVPDVGRTRGSFEVDELAFLNGFDVTQEIFVQENEGENKGEEAGFTVTYSIYNEVQ